jgi:hypothetical protein
MSTYSDLLDDAPREYRPQSRSAMEEMKKAIRAEMAERWGGKDGNTYIGDGKAAKKKKLVKGPEVEEPITRRGYFDLVNGWTLPEEKA